VPWQQEREDRIKIDTLNEEIAVLTKQLKSYSEACLELAVENDSIEVRHFNAPYFFNFISFVQLKYLFGLRKYFLFSLFITKLSSFLILV